MYSQAPRLRRRPALVRPTAGRPAVRRPAGRVRRLDLERLEPRLLLSASERDQPGTPVTPLTALETALPASDVAALPGLALVDARPGLMVWRGTTSGGLNFLKDIQLGSPNGPAAGTGAEGPSPPDPGEPEASSPPPDGPPGAGIPYASDTEMASAVPLPFSQNMAEVKDSVDRALGAKLYHVRLGDDTASLSIDLRSSLPWSPLGAQFTMYDGTGRPLMGLTPAGEEAVDIHVGIEGPLARGEGRDIYLKVAPPRSAATAAGGDAPNAGLSNATGSGPDQPAGFVLVVQRQPANPDTSSGESSASQDVVVLVPSQGVEPALVVFPEDAGLPAEAAAPPAETEPTAPGPVPVATGPLPTRVAAPLGGMLATGDPAPVVTGGAAVVDLALIDLLPPEPEAELEQIADAMTERLTEPGGGLVALRGSGGFPLLASSLITEDRSRRAPSLPGLPAVAVVVAVAAPAPAVDEPPPGVAAEGAVARALRRMSTMAGALLALSFASGLVLPDVTDPFRPEEPRRVRARRSGKPR